MESITIGKMVSKRMFLISFAMILLLVGTTVASAYFASPSVTIQQTTQPGYQTPYSAVDMNTYWPALNNPDTCNARQDVMLQVTPFGCSPSVVSSDLLAEQNVPVFCQLSSMNVNPLMTVKNIKNIGFSGKYPDSVASVGFHPAQVALKSTNVLTGTPLVNNVGYVVIVLKKNEKEATLPNTVNLTLTATLDYDAGNAMGIGPTSFSLNEVSDSEWQGESVKNSFWDGKYSIRAEHIDINSAIISLYYLGNKIGQKEIQLNKGSGQITIPGAYCQGSLEMFYDGVEAEQDSAKLDITSTSGTETTQVYKGSTFLNQKCTVSDLKVNDLNSGSVRVVCGSNKLDLSITPLTTTSVKDVSLGTDGDTAFNEAINSYTKIADDYTFEKAPDGVKYLGQEALEKGISLAKDSGKMETAARLLGILVNKYPDLKTQYQPQLDALLKFDSSKAAGVITVDNLPRTITLSYLSKPKAISSAKIHIGNSEYNLHVGDSGKQTGVFPGSRGSVQITKLTVNQVDLKYQCNELASTSGTVSIQLGKSVEICGTGKDNKDNTVPIAFVDSDIAKVAKVRVVPTLKNVGGQANFSVGIGIEKRAIQLSPERTKSMIANLDASVAKWEKISNTLGTVVKGLKTACLATSAILTFTNLISGFSGEMMARQDVMRGDDGWSRFCEKEVAAKRAYNLNDCYITHASEIEKDVASKEKVYETVNKKIDTIQQGAKIKSSSALSLTDNIDTDKVKSALAAEMVSSYGDKQIQFAEGQTWEGVARSKLSVSELLTNDNVNSMTYNQVRDLYLNLESEKQGGFSSGTTKGFDSAILKDITDIDAQKKATDDKKANDAAQKSGVPAAFYSGGNGLGKTPADIKDISALPSSLQEGIAAPGVKSAATTHLQKNINYELNGVKKTIPAGDYLLGLETLPNGDYRIKKAVAIKGGSMIAEEDSGKLVLESPEEVGAFTTGASLGVLSQASRASYHNSYENPVVQYYDVEPYKGMPALVPIDRFNGWYAATKMVTPAMGGIGAFDASGRVMSFSLCNVGPNHKAEFHTGLGDDTCRSFDLGTGQSLAAFPGLSESEAKALVTKAISAINDAANGAGSKTVRIGSDTFSVGDTLVGIPSTQCQEFMSPTQCQLLFNVCDPVICPASRCNFGGSFPVNDVIQTGIVGSAILCLPNIQEGVYMPVCLTGIQAGVDAFTSIIKAHRDCLKENLATGKLVGFCDQQYSIYLCKLFWEQAAPMAGAFLPKLISWGFGQGARGGGEYLTVNSAWKRTEDSMKYFTQTYGFNAIEVFKVQALTEIGGQFCKSFISAKAPSSIQSVIEPKSPPQFTATFSSQKFSTATYPATAQYKVNYHIFAGKEAGAYFSVYLKSPTESQFYTSASTLSVASGFIAMGEYADETKDFTAPEGYKELCVNVNGQERCGFKEVSTSLAVNFLTDQYVAQQATETKIESASACVSGTPSVGSLAGIVAGSGISAVQEAALPQIYNQGVIRICSTANPGSATDPSRFVEVGYCDDPKMKCWMDKQSVAKAVADYDNLTRSSIMGELNAINQKNLEVSGGAQQFEAGGKTEIDKLNVKAEAVKALPSTNPSEIKAKVSAAARFSNEVTNTFALVIMTYQKGQVLMIEADVKADLARMYVKNKATPAPAQPSFGTPLSSADIGFYLVIANEKGVIVKTPDAQALYDGSIALNGKLVPNFVLSNNEFQLNGVSIAKKYESLWTVALPGARNNIINNAPSAYGTDAAKSDFADMVLKVFNCGSIANDGKIQPRGTIRDPDGINCDVLPSDTSSSSNTQSETSKVSLSSDYAYLSLGTLDSGGNFAAVNSYAQDGRTYYFKVGGSELVSGICIRDVSGTSYLFVDDASSSGIKNCKNTKPFVGDAYGRLTSTLGKIVLTKTSIALSASVDGGSISSGVDKVGELSFRDFLVNTLSDGIIFGGKIYPGYSVLSTDFLFGTSTFGFRTVTRQSDQRQVFISDANPPTDPAYMKISNTCAGGSVYYSTIDYDPLTPGSGSGQTSFGLDQIKFGQSGGEPTLSTRLVSVGKLFEVSGPTNYVIQVKCEGGAGTTMYLKVS